MSLMSLNPMAVETDRSRDVRMRKRKTKGIAFERANRETSRPGGSPDRWKTSAEQQRYTCKLLQAVRELRLSNPEEPAPRLGRVVRETADQVLAVAAKGRTRWSRAILKNRIKLKFIKHHRRQRTPAPKNHPVRRPRISIALMKCRSLPAVQRRVRELGRMVPGCGTESIPVILEEAYDYIAALKMQVKSMTSVLEQLSNTAVGSPIVSSINGDDG